MRERFAAGRDVEHWRRIHDLYNGLVPRPTPPSPPTAADLELRAHLARHGCCGG